jgi:hypothetical protein
MPMNCDGCTYPIVEAQHYLEIQVELATRMSAGWASAMEPTVFKVRVHNPDCFRLWAAGNPIIQDVFARAPR